MQNKRRLSASRSLTATGMPLQWATDLPGSAFKKQGQLEQLYERYWSEVCNYLKKTFGAGPPDPEDVTQQAFVRFASLENPAEITNPRAYLYRTACHILVDEHRKIASRGRVVDCIEAQGAQKSDDFTPERVLLAKERLNVLENAIRAMPEQRRQSFLFNRLHGLSCAEIARRTGYSESAVKKHISLAMADLDAALAQAERSKDQDKR